MRHQQDERVLEAARDRQRRRRRRVVFFVIAAIMLAVSAVVAKIAWDRYRLSSAVSSAEEHLEVGTADELGMAAESLARGLAVAPSDDDSLALMALVRAHQAALTSDTTALDAATSAVGGSESPAATVSAAVGLALKGDLDAAAKALDEAPQGDESVSLTRVRAWLSGIVALGRPFDRAGLKHALASLGSAVDGSQWAPIHRVYASVQLRLGKIDEALASLEAARGLNATDLGLAADEALTHAIVAKHTGGVKEVAARLLADQALPARDRGRLHLAQGLVALRKGKDGDISEDLDAAWDALPEWDADSRALVVESALLAGQVERAKTWLKALEPDDTTKQVYNAWVMLLDGDVTGCLEACAKIDQNEPRVAYVQALALVEQKRFAEAKPWIDRALALYGPRIELQVAAARVQANTGDAPQAAKVLQEITEANHSARGLTALGEAQLLIAGEEGDTEQAAKTLREALGNEPRPAEAAYLLGNLMVKQAEDKPSLTPKAIDLLRKAVEYDGSTVRYRAALGQYLARYGDLDDADEVLRPLINEDVVPGKALVALAGVAIERAERDGTEINTDEVNGWLDKSAQLGATPVEVAVHKVRVQLAMGDDALLPTVAANLAGVLKVDPNNTEARVLYGETLRRLKDYPAARTMLREGGAERDPYDDGRVLIARASVERSDGSDRLAASLAWKGWQKLAQLDMPANERMRLARATADFWSAIENRPVQRSISKAVVDKIPWRADAWAFRALTQLGDARTDEGCETADKALEMAPKLHEAHASKAECFIARRQYPEARKSLTEAIELAPGQSDKRAYRRRLRILR